ncbi:MAG TPA: hypothetical protein DC054_24665 [Blastocatellia bacterium]|nr:hypothetical protein [Blastocatellia bacterium]
MVRRRYAVTEGERGALNQAANLLRTKQEDLAKISGVSQAWISITLSGKKSKREVDNLGRLARALLELFQLKRGSLDIDAHMVSELTKTLGRLASLSDSGAAAFISPPGRPVPANALNYVRRPVDDLVDKCLRNENLSLYIAGPFQSGKTSLLIRLQDEVKKRGFETAYFSCKSLAKPRFFSDSGHVFRLYTSSSERKDEEETDNFFRSLQEMLANTWGLDPWPQGDAIVFPSWVQRHLSKFGPNHQALIVLDDLGYLSPSLIYKISSDLRTVKNTNSFVSFARGLVVGSPRVLEYMKEEERLMATPMVSSVSPMTEKGDWWFGLKQLRQLFIRVGANHSELQLEQIHRRYGGQPLISHLVAVNADLGSKDTEFEDHLKQLESQWSAFELHKNLIRETLIEAAFMHELRAEGVPERLPPEEFLEKLEDCYPKLIQRIMGGVQDLDDPDKSFDFVRPYLLARNIVIVKEAGKVMPSCDWYRDIANELGKDIEDKNISVRLED